MSNGVTIIYNFISIGTSHVISFFVFYYLIRKKPSFDKRGVTEILLLNLFHAVLGAYFYRAGFLQDSVGRPVTMLIIWYLSAFGSAFCLKRFFQEQWSICWTFTFFLKLIEECAANLALLLDINYYFYDLSVFPQFVRYCVVTLLFAPLIDLLFLYMIKKVGVLGIFWNWLKQGEFHIRTIAFLSLFPIWNQLMFAFLNIRYYDKFDEITWTELFVLIFFILFIHMTRGEMQEKQLKVQQISLAQQKNYIESLEGLQKEMRMFRHDYKNMMSSMYLQAKEGDYQSLQTFIQNMTEDFDSQVGGQIQRMTQLGNIHVLELKGLLFEKLAAMQKEKIECSIEAIRPFYTTKIRSTDLCRCFGILIDNAMEEVCGHSGAKIEIMISSQGKFTTFRIKNPLFSNVDFHKIWQEGYSTRGCDRGIGLASYQKILARYDNVLPITTVKDGYFIQEFKVLED